MKKIQSRGDTACAMVKDKNRICSGILNRFASFDKAFQRNVGAKLIGIFVNKKTTS